MQGLQCEGRLQQQALELRGLLIAGAMGPGVRISSSADRGCVRFWSKGKKVSYAVWGVECYMRNKRNNNVKMSGIS